LRKVNHLRFHLQTLFGDSRAVPVTNYREGSGIYLPIFLGSAHRFLQKPAFVDKLIVRFVRFFGHWIAPAKGAQLPSQVLLVKIICALHRLQ